MLFHILVTVLAQSALAVIPEMVVVEADYDAVSGHRLASVDVLIPNHAKRGLGSVLWRPKGKSHSFYFDDWTIDFHCKAGLDLECQCSMEAKLTNAAKSPIKKKDCVYLRHPRDSKGRCLVQFKPSFGHDIETFGSCMTLRPKSSEEFYTLKTVSLQTFVVPKQPVAWAVTIGNQQMAIQCGTEDLCACSMLPMSGDTEAEATICTSSTLSGRDSLGNCRVSYGTLNE